MPSWQGQAHSAMFNRQAENQSYCQSHVRQNHLRGNQQRGFETHHHWSGTCHGVWSGRPWCENETDCQSQGTGHTFYRGRIQNGIPRGCLALGFCQGFRKEIAGAANSVICHRALACYREVASTAKELQVGGTSEWHQSGQRDACEGQPEGSGYQRCDSVGP